MPDYKFLHPDSWPVGNPIEEPYVDNYGHLRMSAQDELEAGAPIRTVSVGAVPPWVAPTVASLPALGLLGYLLLHKKATEPGPPAPLASQPEMAQASTTPSGPSGGGGPSFATPSAPAAPMPPGISDEQMKALLAFEEKVKREKQGQTETRAFPTQAAAPVTAPKTPTGGPVLAPLSVLRPPVPITMPKPPAPAPAPAPAIARPTPPPSPQTAAAPVTARPVGSLIHTLAALPVVQQAAAAQRGTPAPVSSTFRFHVGGNMVPMPAAADDVTFLGGFLDRLVQREPQAMTSFCQLAYLAKEGNPDATFALARLQSVWRRRRAGTTMAAGALPGVIGKPLTWATGFLANVLAKTGGIVQGAGHVAGNAVHGLANAASVPFTSAAHVVARL